MKKFLLPCMILLFALVLVACGGNATPTAQTSQDVNIKLTTNPDPAKAGNVELSFMITDKNGSPLEDATVTVKADHPAMSGMGMEGQATALGGGKYAIKADFSDSGDWKITVNVKKGDLDATQELDLKIE